MRLLQRDLEVLKALDKLRVLDINLISSLVGINEGTCKNRMRKLVTEGYVKYYQESKTTKRYYTVTKKGMAYLYPPRITISKSGKIYKKVKKAPTINKRTLDHEIKVAEVLNHILRFNDNLSIDDFKTERDMQRKMKYMQIRNQHICDLLCEKYKIKIEVELSVKQKNKLSRNIIFNTSNYVQIWFVNSDMLYKRLLDEKKYLEEKYLIKIIKLNNICDADLDLSSYYKEINEKFGVISTEKKEMYQQMNIFEIK